METLLEPERTREPAAPAAALLEGSAGSVDSGRSFGICMEEAKGPLGGCQSDGRGKPSSKPGWKTGSIPGRTMVSWLGGYALAAAMVTLLGWVVHAPRLTDWIGSGISTFPNAAVATGCLSVAMLLTMKRALLGTVMS